MVINKLDIKIYTRKITMHPFFSDEAKSLITALLTVNPKQRLGSGPNGSLNVKSHLYFKGTNWEDIREKRISPPFIPKIKDQSIGSQVDLSNFDPMFTKENVLEPQSERKDKEIFGDNTGNDEFSTNTLNMNNKSKEFHSSGNNYDGFTYIKNNSLSLLDKE